MKFIRRALLNELVNQVPISSRIAQDEHLHQLNFAPLGILGYMLVKDNPLYAATEVYELEQNSSTPRETILLSLQILLENGYIHQSEDGSYRLTQKAVVS